jgi:enoyl-CoA hydratase/carnithine racemase
MMNSRTPAPGVAVQHDGPVATVTLMRADKHNAITPELDQAMGEALRTLGQDDSVRVVILTGQGDKAFCTGADIPTLFPHLRERVQASPEPINFCGLTHVHPLPGKALISAINGLALGGGFELALASDLRIASSTAQFGLPEPRWGVVAGAGGCTRVLNALPQALAAEVLFAGRRITAAEALHWGLVSRIVEPDQLMQAANDMAARIVQAEPKAMAGLVEFWRTQYQRREAQSLADERQLFQALITSPESRAGIEAFMHRNAK